MRALVENVELLCLDAGNTIIFLDHPRIARFLVERGVDTTADALVRAEGVAKRGLEGNGDGELVRVDWPHQKEPGALGWGLVIGTTIALGGTPRDRLVPLLDALWLDHVRKNLYSLVPSGLPPALERLRAAGVKTAVISNSEGMLKRLFDELDITAHFDTIVDSGLFGVEKPDPRIFQVALDMFSIPAERALHLGDTVATDVDGARAAGIRTALLDPYLHYDGLHTGIPRVESVEQVADAILRFKRPTS